jgi:hypothetical protein
MCSMDSFFFFYNEFIAAHERQVRTEGYMSRTQRKHENDDQSQWPPTYAPSLQSKLST